MEIREETGTLEIGEVHPMSHSAMNWIKGHFLENYGKLFQVQESLASCALSGNRMAEVCHETLRRLIEGEPVSDRYLLGLAWFLRSMEDGDV